MLTKYAASKILYELTGLKQSTIFDSANIYLGLSKTEPTSTGGNVTEPAATIDGESSNYFRFKLGYYSNMPSELVYMNNPTATGGPFDYVTNKTEIHFNVALKNWTATGEQITHVCLFNGNAATSKLLAYGALTTPITAEENTVVVIPVGGFSISIAE